LGQSLYDCTDAFSGRLTDEEFERANRRNKNLKWDDFEWVRDNCGDCTQVGAEVATQIDIQQDGQEFFGCVVFGDTASMQDITDKEIARAALFRTTTSRPVPGCASL